MKRPISILILMMACVCAMAQTGTNISRYPRTNFVGVESIFLFSNTNVSTNTSFGITASNLFYQITNGLAAGVGGDAGGTNSRQFGSQNLTNWSTIPTGAMANVVATDFLTNWANAVSNYVTSATNAAQATNWITLRQPADTDLTNWANIPTGAMANVVSATFLTNWANAISNYVTASTNAAQATNWITLRQPADTDLTNWANIPTGAMANVVSTTFLTNWTDAVSNYVTAATNSLQVVGWMALRQPASDNLTNWSKIPTNEMASVYFVQSNTLPVFPNLARQMLNGKPMRFGMMGDSIGSLTMDEAISSLVPFHGRNGAALYGGNYLGPTLGSTATNVTRLTNWFIQYQDIGTAGSVTYSNFFGIWTWADRLGCEFLFQTNGGTFKLQLQTNGGAFVDVLTGISTATGNTNMGGVTNVTMLPGYYCAKVVQTAGGLVSVLGVDLWATNGPGVRVSYLNAGGTTMQDMAGVPSSVSEPVLRHLNLDLLTLEGTTDPTAGVEGVVSNLNRRSFTTLTNTDLVFLGTTPVDPSFAFDHTTFNAAYRKVAADNQRFFLDQSIISGTFSNMQVMGWSGDGLHRSNNLSRLCASALMQYAKLFDTTMDNEGRLLSRSNMFNGPMTVSNTLAIAGPLSQLHIYDRVAGIPRYPGDTPFHASIDVQANIVRYGFITAGGAFEGYSVVMRSPYGPIFLPSVMGDGMGATDYPFTFHGTNSVDYGVPTWTNNNAFGVWTVAGAGNGNTNYTPLATRARQFMGSSNVSITAIMNYRDNVVMPWSIVVTNLSADTWGFQFPPTTNRVLWFGLQGGGTNMPKVLTNNTALVLEGESRGTNTIIKYYYLRPGLL